VSADSLGIRSLGHGIDDIDPAVLMIVTIAHVALEALTLSAAVAMAIQVRRLYGQSSSAPKHATIVGFDPLKFPNMHSVSELLENRVH